MQARATHTRLGPGDISKALKDGSLAADAARACKAAAVQGARLEAQNHTLRDTVGHYRKDTMDRLDGERRKQITITGKGWAALAFTAGAVLVAVAWWIIDTAILTSPVGPDTTWLIDLDSLRPWALALWIGSNVTGWCAGIAYMRMAMPVAMPVAMPGGDVCTHNLGTNHAVEEPMEVRP